ncbi:NAD(P)-binding protein [Nadsonia fulvescens var. elongata DSM 6958]|uniref:NAD(P)-binding protein n=1 Tax=Nadsonia fulvescens var. elongata DSM 6958 TaxID=857566 RepID=A0A1E3PLL1_9ASCO|nr:NAD(P)-binding protein [Nadsonia fulvescens var. elongata DSM 6958]
MSSQTLKKSLVVVGGTGFLGKRICQAAVAAGWQVTSVSRYGKLKSLPTGPPTQNSWISQVNWVSADVFNKESLAPQLRNADAVVHSMGVLFEKDKYKDVINAPVSGKAIANSMKSFISSCFSSSAKAANPLNQTLDSSRASSTVEPNDHNRTYNKVNRDSAILLANTFAEENATKGNEEVEQQARKPFVYISAEYTSPMIPSGYIQSKRQAEDTIARIPSLRPILVRPGFMYDKYDGVNTHEPHTVRHYLGGIIEAQYNVSKTLGLDMAIGAKPTLAVQDVANAVVEALNDSSIEGVVSLAALKEFSR